MNINYNLLLTKLSSFIYIIITSYLVSLLLLFFLPSSGVNYFAKHANKLPYKSYQLNKATKSFNKTTSQTREYKLLSNIKLNGVYSNDNGDGWIIIQESRGAKTHILEKGNSFKGYLVKHIFAKKVIFEKNNQEYKLEIKHKQKLNLEVIDKENSL